MNLHCPFVCACAVTAFATFADGIALEVGFRSPPDLAKPQTWYHLMNGNVTKAGITRDFEEIGAWIEGAERYFLQPFADRDTVPNRSLSAPDPGSLREFRDVSARFVKFADIRGIDT